MCGIACILEIRSDPIELRERAVAMARTLRHRGPDWSGVYADDRAVLGARAARRSSTSSTARSR